MARASGPACSWPRRPSGRQPLGPGRTPTGSPRGARPSARGTHGWPFRRRRTGPRGGGWRPPRLRVGARTPRSSHNTTRASGGRRGCRGASPSWSAANGRATRWRSSTSPTRGRARPRETREPRRSTPCPARVGVAHPRSRGAAVLPPHAGRRRGSESARPFPGAGRASAAAGAPDGRPGPPRRSPGPGRGGGASVPSTAPPPPRPRPAGAGDCVGGGVTHGAPPRIRPAPAGGHRLPAGGRMDGPPCGTRSAGRPARQPPSSLGSVNQPINPNRRSDSRGRGATCRPRRGPSPG